MVWYGMVVSFLFICDADCDSGFNEYRAARPNNNNSLLLASLVPIDNYFSRETASRLPPLNPEPRDRRFKQQLHTARPRSNCFRCRPSQRTDPVRCPPSCGDSPSRGLGQEPRPATQSEPLPATQIVPRPRLRPVAALRPAVRAWRWGLPLPSRAVARRSASSLMKLGAVARRSSRRREHAPAPPQSPEAAAWLRRAPAAC